MTPAKRTKINKAGLRSIADRLFPTYKTLDSYSRDGLIKLITERGHCEGMCKCPFDGKKPDWDHKIPVSQQQEGDDPCWQALCKPCHAVKTKQDQKDSARCRRLRGETGQYKRRKARGGSSIRSNPKITSRGFQKAPKGHSAWGRRPSNVKQLEDL